VLKNQMPFGSVRAVTWSIIRSKAAPNLMLCLPLLRKRRHNPGRSSNDTNRSGVRRRLRHGTQHAIDVHHAAFLPAKAPREVSRRLINRAHTRIVVDVFVVIPKADGIDEGRRENCAFLRREDLSRGQGIESNVSEGIGGAVGRLVVKVGCRTRCPFRRICGRSGL